MSKKEMKQLAKSVGQKVPEKHEFDKKDAVNKRIDILVHIPKLFSLIYNIFECYKSINSIFTKLKYF